MVGMANTIPPERFPPRLSSLGFEVHVINEVEYILPPLCRVPAGSFLMGSDPARGRIGAYDNEQPQHTVTLPDYDIARYPVTVAEYGCFVRTGQREPNDWQTQLGKLDHPVVRVSWHDAVAYAAWLSERTGERWWLPTEAEWEKAARGTDGQIYPWGDAFDTTRCNTSESGKSGTTPVGTYPAGASPYGAQDLAGNVWEWTGSRYLSYPYTTSFGREDLKSTGSRVLRGGSWVNDARKARAAYRVNLQPWLFSEHLGFRVVRAAPS
jgi:formylglycine-generating enzyme required for sulfatase activity